jgi:hypothetical protein
MAISTVSPFGNRRKQSEETVAFDQQLTRLEDDIRKLKIEFDIYFNGTSKRPPLEARARIEAFIRRVSDSRTITYAQRYQLSMLVSRYTSYRELWRRTLRAKGDELV